MCRAALRSLGLAPLLLLAACGGGGGGGVAFTPAPTPAPAPTPTPTPTTFDTAEYRRSNGAVQARAISAYNAGATGAGITVGVIDSGVATGNDEFIGKISPDSGDFAGSRGLVDEGGHGTAVSEVLLGAKNDSGVHGIAFAATLLVLRTDTPGSCAMTAADGTDGCSYNDNAIARGLDRATSVGARVVNISLGGAPANGALRGAINRATAAGVIIVISAGNDFDTNPALGANPDPLAQIAIDPIAHGLVLIAGATDSTMTITDFSNRAGNSAASYLTALGVRVRSIDQTGTAFLYGGTSLSAPQVSGAVALLAQAFPALTSAQLVDLLLRTATDLGAPGTDSVYGHGELNLERAFAPQGSLSLGGEPVSLTSNATLGTAMGDAGQVGGSKGLPVTIRDGYGRDYGIDLAATLRTATRYSRLAPALTGTAQGLSARAGNAVLALSVAGDMPQPLRLAGADAARARVLAGSIAARIDAHTVLAFGLSSGADGLARNLAGTGDAPFLIAERGDAGGIAARVAAQSVAVRHQFGRFGLTAIAERGDLGLYRSADDIRAGAAARTGYDSMGFGLDTRAGPVTAELHLTRFAEYGTVLGGRFGPALGGGGAVSWFGDVGLGVSPLPGLRLGGTIRHGWTQLTASGPRSASTLASRALSAEASYDALPGGASLAARWSEPLRVTRGSLDLPGFGDGAAIGLTPQGHERDLELLWSRPFDFGALTGNLYWRQQPGNIAAAPADIGLAFRLAARF